MGQILKDKVPGIQVPASMIERLDKSSDALAAGVEIALCLAEKLTKLCHGIHLMVVGKDKDFTSRTAFLLET